MNPVAPLGCLYLSIQIESVFIYEHHIETHYIELADYLPTTQQLLSLQLHTIMCFYMVEAQRIEL